ncbi:MAG: hypothetical protein ACPG4Z_08605 [Chitinophagales bacterium]
MKNLSYLFFAALSIVLFACDDDTKEEDGPQLIFKYTFSDTQERLGNLGQPVTVGEGNAAQSPDMKLLGIHSVELINTPYTLPYQGAIVYQGEETYDGGGRAIDFAKEKMVSHGDELTRVPISSVAPGTYTYIRNSLAYQNGDIEFLYNDPTFGEFNITSSIAVFLGFNQYIKSHTVTNQSETINANKPQGYWAFEMNEPIGIFESGQSAGTTVPNILSSTSPIPSGSCLVTGEIEGGLTITGDETEDIIVHVSISTNNSFEWTEVNEDGKFEPAAGEVLVDMGTRGIEATVEY